MLTLNPSGAFSVAPSGLGIGREGFGCGAVGSGSWGTRCCAIKTAHTETAPAYRSRRSQVAGKPEARSQKPEAKKPEAKKPEARSQKPEASSQHRESPFWLLDSFHTILGNCHG